MSDLKYDPEFPYVARSTLTGYASARFHKREAAEAWLNTTYAVEIIDTTPKPKIPEDAQHITWGKKQVAYSRHYDGLWYGWNHGRGLSEAELLTWIGDDEVTVLVHKEES